MSKNPPVVYLDCETTGLHPARRAWEIAFITPTGKARWFIDQQDLDMVNADPMALKVGRFYDRHPHYNRASGSVSEAERWVLDQVERYTRGAQLHGSNPGFDAATLDARMRAHGILPSWHYKPVCVATLAQGWLRGRGEKVPDGCRSEDLSRAVGVDPDKYDRHTAMGDCEWMAAVHAVILGTTR